MYTLLKNSKCQIQLYLISEKKVEKSIEELSNYTLASVPGTMNLHQIVTTGETKFAYRDVSCLCKSGQLCFCYHPRHFSVPVQKDVQVTHDLRVTHDVQVTHKFSRERQHYFDMKLQELQSCSRYSNLQRICKKLEKEMEWYPLHFTYSTLMPASASVDEDAKANVPNDVEVHNLVPVAVSSDGDCLPHTGSMFIFEHENAASELRVRIIVEQVVHQKLYLDYRHLRQGIDLTEREARLLLNNYCLYSEQYAAKGKITNKVISNTYQSETLSIVKKGVYMGIWQIFALASVLGAKICSVYPQKGNPNVRKDFHRLIMPRQMQTEKTLYLMWTSTRFADMVDEHFVPNHFVPFLLPQKCHSNGKPPSNTVENISIDKYVIVNYDGILFPGIVTDEDHEDIEVKCLHRVGGNRFFWPHRDDILWYSKDNVIAEIPPPERVTDRHVQICSSIWQEMFMQN